MRARKFLGNYLSAQDVSEPLFLHFEKFEETKFEDSDRPKCIAHFRHEPKSLVMNSTNLNRMIAHFGTDETDDWIGKPVILYVDKEVPMGGKLVEGLRLRAPTEKEIQLGQASPF